VDNGKKGRHNLSPESVRDYLLDQVSFREDEEKIELVIDSKGLKIPSDFDWEMVRNEIRIFSDKFKNVN
jgi:hypothetical protein